MTTLWQIIGWAVGGVLLYYGAEYLVKGGVRAATKLGVTPLVIGLTLVSFATSAPELVISVDASLHGSGDLSIGNIVGSNLCNIALILGLCAVVTPLSVNVNLLKFDMPVMIFASLLFAGMFLARGPVLPDGAPIGRIEGGILFACLLGYVFWNLYRSRKEKAAAEDADPEVRKEAERAGQGGWILPLVMIAGGLGALVLGARLFVNSSVYFAKLLHISEAVIGLTIVAVGTSLPELATSFVAALKGEKDIAIGNVVGSNIFNIFGVMGLAPLVKPLQFEKISTIDLLSMLGCALILFPIMLTSKKIGRAEGAFLLLLYTAYTVYLLYANGVFHL